MKQFFSAMESFLTIVLEIAGIAGLAYSGFREDGWVTRGFTRVMDTYIDTPLIALGLTAAMFFSYRAYNNRKNKGGRGKAFDWIVYLLMAVGVYFIARYFLHGEVAL